MVNNGYADVGVVTGGYAQVQSWSLVDMLMCSGGQWWIFSCVELINAMVDILMFSGGQCWICSGAVVVYDGYAHVY